MLQEPVKEAPGSIASLFVTISPSNFAVDFKAKSSDTEIEPFNSPETSAFEAFTLPSTIPVEPTTTFPLVFIEPESVPSTRISPEKLSRQR